MPNFGSSFLGGGEGSFGLGLGFGGGGGGGDGAGLSNISTSVCLIMGSFFFISGFLGWSTSNQKICLIYQIKNLKKKFFWCLPKNFAQLRLIKNWSYFSIISALFS